MLKYEHSPYFLFKPVKIYCELKDAEAKKLHYDHNVAKDYVKATSVTDMLKFFRAEPAS